MLIVLKRRYYSINEQCLGVNFRRCISYLMRLSGDRDIYWILSIPLPPSCAFVDDILLYVDLELIYTAHRQLSLQWIDVLRKLMFYFIALYPILLTAERHTNLSVLHTLYSYYGTSR